MKIRNGFVSNSSSSSFVVLKRYVNFDQYDKFLKENNRKGNDSWEIKKTRHFITGTTWMNNFDAPGYLESIGVPSDEIFVGEAGDQSSLKKQAVSRFREGRSML